MKIWLSVFLLLLLAASANGQERQRLNTLYLEIGGPAIPYNLGYERVLKVDDTGDLRIKGGAGITITCHFCNTDDVVGSREVATNLSMELLRLQGKKKGRFEYGAGVGRTNFEHLNAFLVSARVGYRFISINNGFHFGIGLNPSILIPDKSYYPFQRTANRFAPYPGIKLGYGF